MAGSQVTIMANQVEKGRLGYQSVSLTNFSSDTLEPTVAAGSKIEIGDALFEFAVNESITGWAGIANSSDVYIHLTVSGASVAASFSTAAPTWDTAKQGWYSGSDRVIGGLYKDGSGNYARKWLYEEKQVASVKRYGNGAVELAGALYGSGYGAALIGEGGLQIGAADTPMLRKIIEIGDWNMDSTEAVEVAHGLTNSKIRKISVMIRGDNANNVHPLDAWFSGVHLGGFFILQSTPTVVSLVRTAGGIFDSESFDSTSYNRGWIVIEYLP